MKEILIGCEESQEVTKAFRDRGFNAFSCDLQNTSGPLKEYHFNRDIFQVYEMRNWDYVISFPPCTDLAVSGARHFEKKRLSGAQEKSINFFLDVWEISNALENPKNIMSGWKKKNSYMRKWYPCIVERMMDTGFHETYTQSIQPYQFGHGETKETWIWLNGLPKLKPTNNVEGRYPATWLMGPSPDRGKLRSKTYRGIANAMADQWGQHIKSIL